MYDLEVTLNKFLNSICDCSNGELDDDYDFINNKVGVYFLVENTGHLEFKKAYSVDIHFYSLKVNKIDLLKLVDKVEEAIGNKIIDGFYFTHKNIYHLVPHDDKDKEHHILTYYANKY